MIRNASKNSHGGKSTYCKDGLRENMEEDFSMICLGLRDGYKPPNHCSTRNNIHVYSFDGEVGHALGGQGTIHRHFPHISYESAVQYLQHSQSQSSTQEEVEQSIVSLNGGGENGEKSLKVQQVSPRPLESAIASMDRPLWQYVHSAVTKPLPGDPKLGYFQQLGYEGSKFVTVDSLTPEVANIHQAVMVPITTVDNFCIDRNIDTVDVIKIDVESFEPQVVEGAIDTLRNRHVKFVTYECNTNYGDKKSLALVNQLYELSFVCYMGGKTNLFVRLTGCWDEKFAKEEMDSDAWERWMKAYPDSERPLPMDRLGGNVYCGHRYRAPALVSLLETYSLHTFANNRRGDVLNDQLLGRPVWIKDGDHVLISNENITKAYTPLTGRNINTGIRPYVP